MKEQPKDKIVEGMIRNCDTGEESKINYYFFTTDSTMETIIKIHNVDSYVHSDDSMQISIDCLALDSGGCVFDLILNFSPKTVGQRDQILRDLVEESKWQAKGGYGVFLDDDPSVIILSDPEYKNLHSDYEHDVELAFKMNRAELMFTKKDE